MKQDVFIDDGLSKEAHIPNLKTQVRQVKAGNRQLKRAIAKELRLRKTHDRLRQENEALANRLLALREENRHYIPR